ncbi:uncharacterized protein K452DRAFT_101518 [Aplosporella prunicola CBS 121167]|uniref:Uncharacterized protein n=1 Tax=Aplosporella prunicola CBS 121167 TaxID=1176127 RepID=A0A6A6B0C9_9PEZI|nr:uncharacterized protein K452DRAFT_101518 [Aplosporella prunicola CBS 121167]KAF2137480.1 hypothetical protein K452DRAFT_101518 [Aplosporella prunicola CBS 121167]
MAGRVERARSGRAGSVALHGHDWPPAGEATSPATLFMMYPSKIPTVRVWGDAYHVGQLSEGPWAGGCSRAARLLCT